MSTNVDARYYRFKAENVPIAPIGHETDLRIKISVFQ